MQWGVIERKEGRKEGRKLEAGRVKYSSSCSSSSSSVEEQDKRKPVVSLIDAVGEVV
jgi:hypothetical protein